MPQIELALWVPPCVVETIQRIEGELNANPSRACYAAEHDLLYRLGTDNRMRAVWTELRSSRPGSPSRSRTETERLLGVLFALVFEHGRNVISSSNPERFVQSRVLDLTDELTRLTVTEIFKEGSAFPKRS